MRIVAVVLWVLAILAEVVGILMLTKYIYIAEESLIIWLVAALCVDLVLVIVASQLWKKANRIAPASEANKLKFWLWNNLGVIVSAIAFLPILLLLLNDKNLDARTKKIASIVAAVALALGIGTSYDWNPVSQEALNSAQEQAEAVSDGQVYWTMFGRKYHLYEDCSSLAYSETLYLGTVDQAFEANRVDLCKFCETRADAGEIAEVVQAAGEELEEAAELEEGPGDEELDIEDAA